MMKKVQPNRKPWILDIEFCPIALRLPAKLATQDMEFRGFRDNDKEKAQSNKYKNMKSGQHLGDIVCPPSTS